MNNKIKLNMQAPINKKVVIFKRGFSSTFIKQVKSGVVSEVEKLLEISKVFDKNLSELKSMTERHSLLEAKGKLDTLRDQEWLKQTEFIEKYLHYLNIKDRKKVIDSLDQGDRMDSLIKEKFDKLNLSQNSTLEEFKESMRLSELTYSNKTKIFGRIEDLFKSTFDSGNMSKAEKDGFNVLLGKRKEEKEIFFNFKDEHFSSLKQKIDSALSTSTNYKARNLSDKPHVTEAKLSSSLTETPSSDSGILPESDEILTVIEELLNYFS